MPDMYEYLVFTVFKDVFTGELTHPGGDVVVVIILFHSSTVK